MSKLYIKKSMNLQANDLELTGNLKDSTYSLTVAEVSNMGILFYFYKGWVNEMRAFRAPFAFNWKDVILSTDGDSGEVTVDIWTDIDANFPPTVADTIFSTAPSFNQTGGKGTAVTSFVGGKESVAAGDWVFCVITGGHNGFVSAIANNGGKCRFATTAAHGLVTNDIVTLKGFQGLTFGIRTVTNVSDTTHFDTNDAYISDQKGEYNSIPNHLTMSCNINKT